MPAYFGIKTNPSISDPQSVLTNYINSETEAYSTNQFTGNSDRNLYYVGVNNQNDDNLETKTDDDNVKN